MEYTTEQLLDYINIISDFMTNFKFCLSEVNNNGVIKWDIDEFHDLKEKNRKFCDVLFHGEDYHEAFEEVQSALNNYLSNINLQLENLQDIDKKSKIIDYINSFNFNEIVVSNDKESQSNEITDIDKEEIKSTTLNEKYTNEEQIQNETSADKTETTENFTEQNKKDTIVAKILIGLIAEREESENYKKIAELEQQLEIETDDNKKQEIQNQIDDLKASWNLTIENQNMDSENRFQPIKIENDMPDFITNDYKILNNQGGKTDNIYVDKEKENALNISHDKDAPVNESSIYASINALCQQMQEQEQNPFVFNFNTRTEVFKKTIYNALSQNLERYNQMGMDAICIDGTTMNLDKFKNFASFEDFDKYTQKTENPTNENIEQQPEEEDSVVATKTPDAPLQENSDNLQDEELESVDLSVPSQEELTEYFSNADITNDEAKDDEEFDISLDGESLLFGKPVSNLGVAGENFQQATDNLQGKMSEPATLDPETLKKMQQGNQNQ